MSRTALRLSVTVGLLVVGVVLGLAGLVAVQLIRHRAGTKPNTEPGDSA